MEKREDGRYVFPEGKYVMIKMPNKPLLSVYQVPFKQSFFFVSFSFLSSLLFRCPIMHLRRRKVVTLTWAVTMTRAWIRKPMLILFASKRIHRHFSEPRGPSAIF